MGRGRGSVVRAGLAIATLAAVRLRRHGAQAQQAAAGDAKRGKALSYTCLGCHGIDGYKNAYPMYSVPKLEGQHPEYLAAALHGYRDGDRAHLTMHSQASTLSDQDILDIATYFAGKPLAPSAASPRRACRPRRPVQRPATAPMGWRRADLSLACRPAPGLPGARPDEYARAAARTPS